MKWPGGKFALPQSVYDCPDLHWMSGFAQIKWQNGSRTDVIWSNDLRVIGPYGQMQESDWPATVLSLKTCAKLGEDSGDDIMWPAGDYCVYKMADDCPAGK